MRIVVTIDYASKYDNGEVSMRGNAVELLLDPRHPRGFLHRRVSVYPNVSTPTEAVAAAQNTITDSCRAIGPDNLPRFERVTVEEMTS